METIHVLVDWCEKNYSAFVHQGIGGVVLVTDKSLVGLKDKLHEALLFHIEGLGSGAPKWLQERDYTLVYDYTMSAILQNALNYTTLSALSRITGISHAQLSHYANAVSRPKQLQKDRIISGLHAIGEACLSV